MVLGSSPRWPTMKKDIFGCLFSVIFAYGKLYCYAVIFGLRRVILCFAQFNGKYNITETAGFNITFDLSKISLQRSWNITKKFLHLFCSRKPKRNDNFRQERCRFFLYSYLFSILSSFFTKNFRFQIRDKRE